MSVTPARPGVQIDRERCLGSGVCAYHAPATFDVGDDGKATLLGGADPPEAIRAAVSACPAHALSSSASPESPK